MSREGISREQLLNELIDHINDPDTTDNSAIQALRVLKKYDKNKAKDLAIKMKNEGLRFVAIREMLLSMIEDDGADIMIDSSIMDS